jgi:allene oxide cyclase-like protein
MTRALAVPLAAALALGAGGAVASLATAAPTTLTLVTKQTASKNTKTTFTFSETVKQKGKRVGTDRGVCTFTPRGAKQPTGGDCTVTLKLAKGTIVARTHLDFSAKGGKIRATGTSGAYKGKSGGGTFTNVTETTTKLVLRLS